MKRNDVKKVIQRLAKEEFIVNPGSYPVKDGINTQDCIVNISEWAENMWECRSDDEVKRDFRLGLNVDIYKVWAFEEFKKLHH